MAGHVLRVKVPKLGSSATEAEVSVISAQVGQSVIAGATLVELETDKVTVAIDAPAAGIVQEIPVSEGDVVTTGEVVCVILAD